MLFGFIFSSRERKLLHQYTPCPLADRASARSDFCFCFLHCFALRSLFSVTAGVCVWCMLPFTFDSNIKLCVLCLCTSWTLTRGVSFNSIIIWHHRYLFWRLLRHRPPHQRPECITAREWAHDLRFKPNGMELCKPLLGCSFAGCQTIFCDVVAQPLIMLLQHPLFRWLIEPVPPAAGMLYPVSFSLCRLRANGIEALRRCFRRPSVYAPCVVRPRLPTFPAPLAYSSPSSSSSEWMLS